jgi:hypothetical protein
MTTYGQDYRSALSPSERQWLVYGGFVLSVALFLAMYRRGI